MNRKRIFQIILKIIRTFSRLFVGALFIFSGFVKAVDPSGSAYKFMDYFTAFHFGFFSFLAFPLAVILATLELFIGLNLLLNIKIKFTSWVLLIVMSYFTILTFILSIFNPVTDCGCFGDALILTNWETFVKNIIIFIPTLVIFAGRKKYRPQFSYSTEWTISAVFIIVSLLFIRYNFRNLPILDFRPYKTGTNIPEKMIIPDGMPADEYEYSFIYEKDNVVQEFKIENLPDSTWNWVETKQKLITKGYEPPIHDFSLTTSDGEDITSELLTDPGYSLLIIAYAFDKTNLRSFEKFNKSYPAFREKNIRVYCLTASTSSSIEKFREEIKPEYKIYLADEITLKTIIRSNPGMLLIKEGTIIGKWHYRNFPSEINGDILAFAVREISREKSVLIILFSVSVFFMAVFLFRWVISGICKPGREK